MMPWIKYLTIILLASVKFAMAPLSAIPMGITGKTLFLCMVFGGFLGFFVFYYLADFFLIQMGIRQQRKGKERKIFSKKNRLVVKMMRKNGLLLLALLTPILLSIPFGAFLAIRYFPKNKPIVLFMMLGGILLWAGIFTFGRGLI